MKLERTRLLGKGKNKKKTIAAVECEVIHHCSFDHPSIHGDSYKRSKGFSQRSPNNDVFINHSNKERNSTQLLLNFNITFIVPKLQADFRQGSRVGAVVRAFAPPPLPSHNHSLESVYSCNHPLPTSLPFASQVVSLSCALGYKELKSLNS